ncbi:FAD/FMN-containing dehydrogenase [Pseudonocardia sp. Ae717_Ps2]|uniref:cholesterol oxidase substrate-binding domain-containing protein n=1 Tax=Pseudonocardia sp. Ae717_Ps2 TaxID=1885573 RepID=UPI0009619503|nr:cholesterol oxidase substrate-binding domain-containing protein [Pseudonocardia sp. Ae717_Ps2]OLM33086.1 FAD/FMN-containing dehydrogenase [Pseudonocardia sp. Ae717_Ps2]
MRELTRRAVLRGAALAGTAVLVGVRTPAQMGTSLPDFPAGVPVHREVFENWDGVITTDPLWTCVPRTPADVVAVLDWAHRSGYRVRPRGYRHNWSPLAVSRGQNEGAKILVADLTQGLTGMTMTAPGEVRVQAGARMDRLLSFLHRNGASITNAPAPGDVTVAGVLAVGGHGSSVPAAGERRVRGQSFGSVSNLVTAVTAVVWDAARGGFAERTFDRSDPGCAALLTGLGRIVLTEVRLRVQPAYDLRCRNHTDIPATEFFAAPGRTTARSMSSMLDRSGRVGAIWYTFSDHPWIQEWTVTPRRPLLSRPTLGPYNYPFADNVPAVVEQPLSAIVSGHPEVAPLFGKTVYGATVAGLTAVGARDMWGPAKDFIHFVKPTTLRVSAGSHAVVVARADAQRVVHEFSSFITGALARYAAQGRYPLNSCVEIRVTGVDDPADCEVPGAVVPALSASQPVPGHPDRDTVVWLDALGLPGTPHEYEFFAEMEAFVRSAFRGYATVRPEWAKRWATTASGPWTDSQVIGSMPQVFPGWAAARDAFAAFDPHRVVTADLHDTLGI